MKIQLEEVELVSMKTFLVKVNSICKSSWIFAAVILFATANAHAAKPLCLGLTKAKCQSLRNQVDAEIEARRVGPLPIFFPDLERDDNGSPIAMHRRGALNFQESGLDICETRHGKSKAHLPTAYEFARLSMSLGAKGIVEACEGLIGCSKLTTFNNQFNFSAQGYQRPEGVLGDTWFWTSSNEQFYPAFEYLYNGATGSVDFDMDNRTYGRLDRTKNHIRCVNDAPVEAASEQSASTLCSDLSPEGCRSVRDQLDVELKVLQVGAKPAATKIKRRIAKSGAVFVRDTSNPKIGEAYRDSSGFIWSGIISDSMNQHDADSTCNVLEAHLPSLEEFQQLGNLLGRDSKQGYSPYMIDGKTDVMPGLSKNSFWLSNGNYGSSFYSDSFSGSDGFVHNDKFDSSHAVLCVSGRYKSYVNHDKKAPEGEQRIAKSGAIFIRDTSNPKLGEAYRDPSGLIWSGIIADSMYRSDAVATCKRLGARLPNREEFQQLSSYLSVPGYPPQDDIYSPYMADDKTDALPGLSSDPFWSSEVFPSNPENGSKGYGVGLNGVDGRPYDEYENFLMAVRCVSGRDNTTEEKVGADTKRGSVTPVGEQRVAKGGAIFTRNNSNPKLGEAYRDPSGLIWSGIISGYMNQSDAAKACSALDAHLPSMDEFLKLRNSLSPASLGDVYSPYMADGKTDIIPGLSSNWFWSSSSYTNDPSDAYNFGGYNGALVSFDTSYRRLVLCVSDR